MNRAWVVLTVLLILELGSVPTNVAATGGEQMSVNRSPIETSGITAEWYFSDDELVVQISAPTNGWIAVGFNLSRDIAGADLFMAARRDTVTVAEHHFVVRAGVHPRVESIGRRSALVDATVSEIEGGTQVVFRLDPERMSIARVRRGVQLYLIVAYSVSSDFDHHSRVRRHLSVCL